MGDVLSVTERLAIDAFLAARGATLCDPAYAWYSPQSGKGLPQPAQAQQSFREGVNGLFLSAAKSAARRVRSPAARELVDKKERALALVKGGMSRNEAARRVGLSPGAVGRYAAAKGVTLAARNGFATDQSVAEAARLSAIKKDRARVLVSQGLSVTRAAREVGLHESTVRRLLKAEARP